jgi:tRNA threonylcarbamoyladenosine biosynthesis protein TsaB
MKTLVIDAATAACSVALFDGHQLVASDYVNIGRGHAERIIPMISELPSKGRADQIAVNVGPGSFTGIRVGIAAARALALAWNIEAHGYSTMQMIAVMSGKSCELDVAITGGHGEYYFQAFDKHKQPIGDSSSLKPDDAANASRAPTIVGDVASDLAKLRIDKPEAISLMPDAKYWDLLSEFPSLMPRALYIRSADAKKMEKAA